MAEKSKANALKEELFYTPKHMATVAEDDLFPKADVFAEGYKEFMSNYKTEREITAFFQAEAEKRGYTEFDKIGERFGNKLQALTFLVGAGR